MRREAIPENEDSTNAPDCDPECSSVDSVDFSELVRLHWGQVFRVCLRITKNKHDAEDASQDCFLRAFTHFQQFQGNAQFSTWLNSIARNSSLMLLRKKRTKKEAQMEYSPAFNGELLQLEPADRGPDQLSRVLYAEGHAWLIRSIAALPDNLRSAADLVIFKELTLQEAAQILEISDACVKSRLFRARRRLGRFHGRGSKSNVVHHNSLGGPIEPQTSLDCGSSKESLWLGGRSVLGVRLECEAPAAVPEGD